MTIYYDTFNGISHKATRIGGISIALETLCGRIVRLHFTDKKDIERSYYEGSRINCTECLKKLETEIKSGILTQSGDYWAVIHNGEKIYVNNPIRKYMIEGREVKYTTYYERANLIISDTSLLKEAENEIMIGGMWYARVEDEIKEGDSFIYFPYPEDDGVMVAELTKSSEGKVCVLVPDEHRGGWYGMVDVKSSSIWKVKLIEQ